MSNIRTRLLQNNLFAEKTMDLTVPSAAPGGEPETLTVLLRQPTVGQRSEIMTQMKVGRDGGLQSGDGLSRGLAMAIIFCTLDIETRKPIFELADLDSLIGQPSGSWFDDLATETMGLMADASEAAKK